MQLRGLLDDRSTSAKARCLAWTALPGRLLLPNETRKFQSILRRANRPDRAAQPKQVNTTVILLRCVSPVWVKVRPSGLSATSPFIPQYQTLDDAGRTAVSAPLFQAVSPWAGH